MRALISLLLLAGAALVSPSGLYERGPCHANDCLRAIRGTESIGLAFCSSTFGLQPVTSTRTVTNVITTATASVTATETETLTVTNTITTTSFPPPPLQKRSGVPPKAQSNILQKCSTDSEKISSACSCFLSGRTVDTVWATATVSSTISSGTLTATTTITTETSVEATETAVAIIQNGGFDNVNPLEYWYLSGSNLGCNLCTHEIVGNDGSDTAPNALKVNWVGQTGVYSIRQLAYVRENKWYRVAFKYKVGTPGGNPAALISFYLHLEFLHFANGAPDEWFSVVSDPVNPGFDDIDLAVSFFVASPAEPTTTEEFYFDDFRIWEVPAPN